MPVIMISIVLNGWQDLDVYNSSVTYLGDQDLCVYMTLTVITDIHRNGWQDFDV